MSSFIKRFFLFALATFFISASVHAQDQSPEQARPDEAVADTARQRAWEHFQQKHGARWHVRWSDRAQIGQTPTRANTRKAPTSVFGALTRPYAGPPEQAARDFLSEHYTLFQMPKTLSDLEVMNEIRLRGVTHVRFQQTYQGLPVYEGAYLVHVRDDGRIDMANGNYYTDIDAPTTSSISESSARRIATDDLGGNVELDEGAETESELVIYPKNDGDTFLLTWKVLVPAVEPDPGHWQYFVDAISGEIVERQNLVTTIAHFTSVQKRKATVEDAVSSPGFSTGASHATVPFAVTGNGTIIPDYPAATSPENRNLTNLDGNGHLNGFFTNVDNEEASNAHESDHNFLYSTSSTHFDEANVYYHITAFFSQYVAPILGFTGDIGSDRDVESEVHDQDRPIGAY